MFSFKELQKISAKFGIPIHLTPEDIAEFYLNDWKGVGREYKDERSVWNADDSVEVRGLLRLILRELRKVKRSDKVSIDMFNHRDWLVNGKRIVADLVKDMDRSTEKLKKRLKVELPRAHGFGISWELSEQNFKNDRNTFNDAINRTLDRIKTINSIRQIDDLIKIEGLGRTRISKLKESVNAQDNKA